jgi:urea transport system substrate-binding protein
MWKAAVEKAGSLDLAKVNAAFADGISLETSFGGPAKLIGSTRHTALPMYLGEMQANGSVKVIKSLGQIAPQQC